MADHLEDGDQPIRTIRLSRTCNMIYVEIPFINGVPDLPRLKPDIYIDPESFESDEDIEPPDESR